jgi:hypothetical protein
MIRLRCRSSSSTERRQRCRGTALFELIAYLVPLLSLALFGLAVVTVRGTESAVSWRVHRDVNRLATDPGWGGPTRRSWDDLEPIQGARLNGESGPAALSLAGLRSSVVGGTETVRLQANIGVFGTLGPVRIERGGAIRRQAWTHGHGSVSYTQSAGDTSAVRGWFSRAAKWAHGSAQRPLRLAR